MWGQLWISLLDLSIRAQLCSHLKRRRCRSLVLTAVSGPRLLQGVAPAPAPDRGLGAIARHRHPLGTDVTGLRHQRTPAGLSGSRDICQTAQIHAAICCLPKDQKTLPEKKGFYLFCQGFAHRNQIRQFPLLEVDEIVHDNKGKKERDNDIFLIV